MISPGASVATWPEATGTVRVIGYGSTWINSGLLSIGAGGQLHIRTGAQAITDALQVGLYGYGFTGSVIVEGYDSALTSQADTYIGGGESSSYLELRQGATFSSNNVYITTCWPCGGAAIARGSATRWFNTGEFVVGAGGSGSLLVEQGAQLFTVNARIHLTNDDLVGPTSTAVVRGWGATWTNEGLLRVRDFGHSTPPRAGRRERDRRREHPLRPSRSGSEPRASRTPIAAAAYAVEKPPTAPIPACSTNVFRNVTGAATAVAKARPTIHSGHRSRCAMAASTPRGGSLAAPDALVAPTALLARAAPAARAPGSRSGSDSRRPASENPADAAKSAP
ncbi:hypothetical protein [Sorangium sp. So ce394]|uniref:hypothetical protein n=1 Tax=Sorangium sp. So ce394 TaxID=3133310 RepID=UPI003F5B0A7A